MTNVKSRVKTILKNTNATFSGLAKHPEYEGFAGASINQPDGSQMLPLEMRVPNGETFLAEWYEPLGSGNNPSHMLVDYINSLVEKHGAVYFPVQERATYIPFTPEFKSELPEASQRGWGREVATVRCVGKFRKVVDDTDLVIYRAMKDSTVTFLDTDGAETMSVKIEEGHSIICSHSQAGEGFTQNAITILDGKEKKNKVYDFSFVPVAGQKIIDRVKRTYADSRINVCGYEADFDFDMVDGYVVARTDCKIKIKEFDGDKLVGKSKMKIKAGTALEINSSTNRDPDSVFETWVEAGDILTQAMYYVMTKAK